MATVPFSVSEVEPKLSGAARQSLIRADEYARQLCHPIVGTEHLLVAILETSADDSVVSAVQLDAAGVRAKYFGG
jgi:ATP-dependent Clp protease ATP-binding subunit ClpA